MSLVLFCNEIFALIQFQYERIAIRPLDLRDVQGFNFRNHNVKLQIRSIGFSLHSSAFQSIDIIVPY